MDFRLLGPLEARTSAGPIPLGPPLQRFVLVAFLLEPNRVIQTTRLIEMMWPDHVPASARNALQVYVSRLRRALQAPLGDPVRIDRVGAGYRMVVDPDAIDLHRFERIVAASRTAASVEETARLLREALALWSGEPLADLDNPWLRHHVCTTLQEAWLDVSEELFEAELRRGNHIRILSQLSQLASRHPGRERLAELLMRALYDAGRRAEALAVYRRVTSALGSLFGVDPGRSLEGLHAAILRNEPLDASPLVPG